MPLKALFLVNSMYYSHVFFSDNGEKAIVDIYGKTKQEIREHIRETFCKTQ